jgi:hypothetical protein
MRRFLVTIWLCHALRAAAEDPPAASTTTTSASTPATTTTAPAPSDGEAADGTLVPWEQAHQYMGQDVTVTGRVVAIHCSPLNCLLAFEPTFNRFTAVVPVNRFDVFPPDQLKSTFQGKQVRVTGRVIDSGNKPEIVVRSADGLRISRGERRRERDQQRQDDLATQAEVLDRLDDALARVETLTERLLQSEARLEEMLASLDHRMNALAAAQAQPSAPSGGDPRSWEVLRTIKRGMSSHEVVRLIGEPEHVEQSGGWEIWYYPGGRSISFDRRGRAQSVAGFPSP